MKEVTEFRTLAEENLKERFPDAEIEVQKVTLGDFPSGNGNLLPFYELTAYIDNRLFRGAGESTLKAIENLTNMANNQPEIVEHYNFQSYVS